MAKRLTVYGIFCNRCADEIVNRNTVVSKIPLSASDKSDLLNGKFNKCWLCDKTIEKEES